MSAGELKFERLERDYRGRHFVLEEVNTEQYDEIIDSATTTREDPLTGQDVEVVDNNLVVKMLLRESLIEPTWAELTGKGKKLPQRLRRQLELDVRTLHFGEEPEKKESKLKKDEDEENDSPNSAA